MAVKTTKKTVKKTLAKKTAIKVTRTAKKITVKKDTKKTAEIVIPLPSEEKQKIIEQFATKAGDTGSPEVQIALLTKRIDKLVSHLKNNPADNHSRRGLLGMISKRRRLINYLQKKEAPRAKKILSKLKLGK